MIEYLICFFAGFIVYLIYAKGFRDGYQKAIDDLVKEKYRRQ